VFFVDTHCHLTLEPLREAVSGIVESAANNGVTKIVVPGLNIKTSVEALEIASKFESVYAAVGIHPNEVSRSTDAQMKQIENLAKEPKVVAIGEIGLDFYRHPENASQQKEILIALLEIAFNCQKPVILHSRNALQSLLEITGNWSARWKSEPHALTGFKGVFHSHEGDESTLQMIHDQHFAIGIGGPVTFKNGIIKQALIKSAGLDNLVLETDSPFLAPHPHRGTVNEPKMIPIIAEKVAAILETTLQEVADKTSANAYSLFRWDAVN
jgi:TatD DNase family protein